MESQYKVNPNIEMAIHSQQKFDFYFLALVFTILGLTVQTSTITGKYQCFFEIASWIFLLVSGLAGLSRLAWQPVFYQHEGLLQKDEDAVRAFDESRLSDVTLVRLSGEQWSEQEIIAEKSKLGQRISEQKAKINKVNKQLRWKYLMHKWCFAIGICLLLISRIVVNLNKLCISL
jgi:hypothetical protein